MKVNTKLERFKEKAFINIIKAEIIADKLLNFKETAETLFQEGKITIQNNEFVKTLLKEFDFINIICLGNNMTLLFDMNKFINSTLYIQHKDSRITSIKNTLGELINIQNELTEEYLQLVC